MAGDKLDPKLQAWVDARRRHHLSHAHVQMARKLGMNPKQLGNLDNQAKRRSERQHRREAGSSPKARSLGIS